MTAAQVERLLRLPTATIAISPPGDATLVHLPTIFWVRGATAAVSTQLALDGASVRVTATPTFTWTFGDGSSLRSTSPGHPYTSGIDPRLNPAGYYITHAYQAPGAVTVTLTVVWQPSYQVLGVAGTFTAQPLQRRSTLALRVEPAQAVLTSNS